MMRHPPRWSPALGLLVVLHACGPAGGISGKLYSGETGEVEETASLGLRFDEAAARWDVPPDVLRAVAYVETKFEPANGEVEFEGQPGPWGYFNLRGDALERGARLAGRSVEEVRGDHEAGVDAAAALLAAAAVEAKLDGEARLDPSKWGPAIERFVALDDAELRTSYAADVLGALASGAAVPLDDGTSMVVRRHAVELPAPSGKIATQGDGLSAAGTVSRPSPNYSSRNGSRIEMVVIHTCEGAYAGCVSWLRNTQASASAHYVVKEDGSEVSHLVDENSRAWHVAASYRSRLNDGQLAAREGQSVNNFSIGIEHAGSASQRSFPDGQIGRSVALVRDITGRHGIPRDRYHIVGHGRLQPENRVDPGPNWPWTAFLSAINSGSAPAPSPQPPAPTPAPTPAPAPGGAILTVDNTTPGRFEASASWDSSTWASGRVGANYRFHAPERRADAASYKFDVTAAGRYEVYARVPGNGYNPATPFIIHHRGGKTVVQRDVSRAGASWVSLGSYDFDRKDDWIVQISCWSGASGWIVADAVRLERR